MRSLYTDDISGTKIFYAGSRSKPSILDKRYFRQQHDLQIQRSPRNPQKKYLYEWYVPLPKAEKQSNVNQPVRNTLKLLSEHTGISRSAHIEHLKKDNAKYQFSRESISNILSQSGMHTVSRPKHSSTHCTDPYYPHRIRDSNDMSVSTRFTGNRQWNENPKVEVHLPDPRSEYISRWSRT